jgi:hypothetical protein
LGVRRKDDDFAEKSREVKNGCNLAESSEESYGSKRSLLLLLLLLLLMMMMKYFKCILEMSAEVDLHLHVSTCYRCPILAKIEMFQQI